MRELFWMFVAFAWYAIPAGLLMSQARGDEFGDRIAALEAKTAAKKTDPFAHANHKVVQDCGCWAGARCTCGETCSCAPAAVVNDPLIQASDLRWYPRSAWGSAGPWGQIGGTYYQTDAGGCSSGSCSSGSSGGRRFRR